MEKQGNHTAQSQDRSQSTKPEFDLQSWAALGGKPSRERRLKRGWKCSRHAGFMDPVLAAYLALVAAVVLLSLVIAGWRV